MSFILIQVVIFLVIYLLFRPIGRRMGAPASRRPVLSRAQQADPYARYRREVAEHQAEMNRAIAEQQGRTAQEVARQEDRLARIEAVTSRTQEDESAGSGLVVAPGSATTVRSSRRWDSAPG